MRKNSPIYPPGKLANQVQKATMYVVKPPIGKNRHNITRLQNTGKIIEVQVEQEVSQTIHLVEKRLVGADMKTRIATESKVQTTMTLE